MILATYDPIELTSVWSLPHFFSPENVESYQMLPATYFSGVDLKIKMTWGAEYFLLLLCAMDGSSLLAKMAYMPGTSLEHPFHDFGATEWAPLAGVQDYILRGPSASDVNLYGELAYVGHMNYRAMWDARYTSRAAYVAYEEEMLSTSYDDPPATMAMPFEPYGDALDEF